MADVSDNRTRWIAVAAAALALTSCGAPPTQSAPETDPVAQDTDAQAREEERLGEEMRDEACLADDPSLPDFAWQPPEPSAKATIPRSLLLAGLSAEEATLSAVADRLEGALGRAGYIEYSYHAIGCDGFALITRLERIEADGAPMDGADRWSPPEQEASWSLSGYISRLFYAPPGYYRQIIFAATDEPYDRDELREPPTRDELGEMLDEGAGALSEAASGIAFTRAHAVHALIYEFEKGEADEEVAQLTPSRLGAPVHLTRAGIYASLDSD